MRRSPYEQWRHALTQRSGRRKFFLATMHPVRTSLPDDIWSAPVRGVQPLDLSSTRPLSSLARRSPMSGDTTDIDAAIRLLQRHNKELQSRFGVGWVDAMNGVLGEATRRGASVALIARALCRSLAARE